jgi:hypothetical protein
MRSSARLFLAAAGVAAGALALTAPAQASIDIGTLACNIGGGPGFIIGSVRPIACTYDGPAGPERYSGTMSKFGMDIGYLNGGEMIWTVLAPNGAPGPARGMLSGDYAGVTGSAAVGIGAGANVLVGGSGRSFALQPVSLEGETGLDVAAGVEGMSLHYHP